MAVLTSIIRKSTTSLAPLALRTLRSQRTYNCYLAKTTLAPNRSPSSMVPTFHYSSESNKFRMDQSLLRILDKEQEVKCAAESDDHDRIDEIPNGFPFKIEDIPRHRIIALKRTYEDEEIHVVVHRPTLVREEGNDYDDADQESKRAMQCNIPIIVNVTKKGGPLSLEFYCVAFPDKIAIESLELKYTESAYHHVAYKGPDFSNLNENLQKSFHEYLEIRGIKPSTTNFLREYMTNKDNKYLFWLKKV